jgi:hypothetical protein
MYIARSCPITPKTTGERGNREEEDSKGFSLTGVGMARQNLPLSRLRP